MAPSKVVGILFSRGGISRPINVAAQNLKNRGVTTVAVTANPTSALAKTCDYVLAGYTSLQDNLTYAVWNCSTSFITDVLTSMLYSRSIARNRSANQEHYDQYVNQVALEDHHCSPAERLVGNCDPQWYQVHGDEAGSTES